MNAVQAASKANGCAFFYALAKDFIEDQNAPKGKVARCFHYIMGEQAPMTSVPVGVFYLQ